MGLVRLTIGGVLRRYFTWRVNLYRLFIGAIILGIALPVEASGYEPLWPVVLAAFVFGFTVAILLPRFTRVGAWLRLRSPSEGQPP